MWQNCVMIVYMSVKRWWFKVERVQEQPKAMQRKLDDDNNDEVDDRWKRIKTVKKTRERKRTTFMQNEQEDDDHINTKNNIMAHRSYKNIYN